MPIQQVLPVGSSRNCSILADGSINFSAQVVQHLGWNHKDRIRLDYVLGPPLTLLLYANDANAMGFTLRFASASKNGKASASIRCLKFCRQILHPNVTLPIQDVAPIFLENTPYQLALMLQTPAWQKGQFNLTTCQQIPDNELGVYQILGRDKKILRIGEGAIRSRIKEHLKDENLIKIAKEVNFFCLDDKEESMILERVLIAKYEVENGSLPTFNMRRS